MNTTKLTSKGTELPLLNLKGKPYLQVAHRLVWFREDHPTGRIVTSLVSVNDTSAVAKAEIYVLGQRPGGEPFEILLSSAHKKETEENFGDFIEKAETGAIGRALAMAGYGTQFEPELDEGERLADTPIEPARKNEQRQSKQASEKPSVEGKGSQAVPAKSSAKERETLNALIRKTATVANSLKKQSMDETLKLIKGYGVDKVEELSDNQAKEVLTKLEGVVK